MDRRVRERRIQELGPGVRIAVPIHASPLPRVENPVDAKSRLARARTDVHVHVQCSAHDFSAGRKHVERKLQISTRIHSIVIRETVSAQGQYLCGDVRGRIRQQPRSDPDIMIGPDLYMARILRSHKRRWRGENEAQQQPP